MLNSKKRNIFILIVLLFILYLFIKPTFFANGNNKDNIIRVIHSLDGYENKKSIKILKIIDDKNERIVPFLYNNSPSYIHFKKNKLGTYKLVHSETHSNENLSIFTIKLWIDRILVVSNDENNIAKIVIKANGKKIIEDEVNVEKKSASFYKIKKLPKQIDHGYELEYELYDIKGNRISQ